VAEALVLALAALVMGYVTRWTFADMLFSWEIEEVAQGTVAIPLWIPKLAMPLGAGLLLVAILDELVTVLRGSKPGYVVAAEERAAAGDFSAEV
jgi:TRAP-type C4-dicarboxylate transport system permease small subunit